MTDKELREMGVEDAVVRKAVLEALAQENDGELQKAYEEAVAEVAAVKKQAALEKAILEKGGRNVKAILALVDMDEVTFDEKAGLKGMDLEALREEVPYLFHEREERKTGTGMKKSGSRKKEDDIRAAFWGLK
ncbi:MAG: phage scaffolding protein [Anaerotignum sp.]|nr:phage scaffolding protein [Anaerotignum sp.]